MGGRAEAPWTLRQLGAVWYVRFRHAGRRHEYSTGQRDRAEAEVHAALLFAKVVSGEWQRDERVATTTTPAVDVGPTFEEVADMWTSGELAEKYRDHVAQKKTAETDALRLTHICKVVGSVPISSFALEDAERVMANLPASAKTSTTRRHYAQLVHRVLALACYPLKKRAHNPIPKGWLPKLSREKATQWLYPDEEAQLVSSPEVPLHRRVFWGFLAREGMRDGEAALLEWSDVDLVRGIVTLDDNKTKNPRAWKLDPGVRTALARYKAVLGATVRARVFAEVWEGEGRNLDGFAEVFRADLARAGVDRPQLSEKSATRDPIRAHDLRATFATVMLATGKSETWVMDRTGHTTSAMLARYKRTARTAAELDIGDFSDLAALAFTGEEAGGATLTVRNHKGYGGSWIQPVPP